MHTFATFPAAIALVAVFASTATSQVTLALTTTATPKAKAAHLLKLASDSLHENDLGLASLRFHQAHRLDPEVASSSAIARELADINAKEDVCMKDGVDGALARDVKAVRHAILCLRQLDAQSSAALEIALRYQAALADQGGAFPRVQWHQWQDKSNDTKR